LNPLRQLASQTAIYGLSSIVGRLLNYLLVPLHTRVFNPGEFGVITEMYSYVAFLLIVLTYGFETAFFRFARNEEDSDKVYSTASLSLILTSLVFVGLCLVFSNPLANAIDYPFHPEYIVWFALILATDAITAIPFARLRLENKALQFALIRLLNIGINIGLNLYWLWLCPYLIKTGQMPSWLSSTYDPAIGVGYVFLANLFAGLVTVLVLLPGMIRNWGKPDYPLWIRMMAYSLPLLVGGLAGITNEMFSRVSLKYQLPAEVAMDELGIFGACYKVAILMTIFIQTFRFAAEPFFFARAKDKNAPELYAQVMHWFIIACSAIYLFVLLGMEWVQFFVGEEFRVGLSVVPILLMANLFLGIFYNLSIWFKLNDKTGLGAWMAIGGALLTIFLNAFLIPRYGYEGASWVTFAVYACMMVVSYALGQKYYPIPYNLLRCVGYPFLAFVLVLFFKFITIDLLVTTLLAGPVCLLAFVAVVWMAELRKKSLISSQT
jgi:O-antigen/teichoic acid export membrane protein